MATTARSRHHVQREARRVGFISLGCPKNQLDCELMLARAQSAGFELTADIGVAEAIVINTCSFIQPAIDEADAAIREALACKRRGSCRCVIVSGCLPQYLRENAAARYPEVDAWLTPDQPLQLPDLLARLFEPGALPPPTPEYILPSFLASHADGRVLTTPPTLAYVKIAEGCNHCCSFCIIPQLRGRYRSRSMADIETEVRALLARGIPEIVLVSQDSSAYGSDRDDGSALAGLLERLCAIDGDFWLRVMYLHPAHLSPHVLDVWARLGPKLLPYFDIPLQHVSRSVLQSMGRGGEQAQIDALLASIRRSCSAAVIRTTLIAGFPGETEEDFSQLLAWVESGAVDRLGVFAYSELPEMRSAALPGKLTEEAKQRRLDALMRAQYQVVQAQAQQWRGKRIEAVVEEVERQGQHWLARGRSWREAWGIDGQLLIRSRLRPVLYRRLSAVLDGPQGYDLLATAASDARAMQA